LHLAGLRALVLGADVLHLHNPPDTLFAVGWAARLLGRVVVFDHHDLTPEMVASRVGVRWAAALARWCERRTFAVASMVLAANESHAVVAMTRGGMGSEHVVVVRNGPRAETLSSGAPVRSGALSDPHLVYLGAVAPQDNADDLPAVLAALRDDYGIPSARLTIIGDGPAAPAVMAEAIRLGVADQIAMTGWLDPERVPPILRDADICVDSARLTRLNDRSTMIKIGEYLAAGRPVVANDLTETRRTVADAACFARTSDPRDLAERVADLAGDERLRREMATRARRRAPELVWELSERALLSAYDSLCPVAPEHGPAGDFGTPAPKGTA
jgi:glycosyltransferase involved in cell wall biosynthesis